MIDVIPVQQALDQIRRQPLFYKQIIDELYRKNSLSHLELLDTYIVAELLQNQDDIEAYITEKIKKINDATLLADTQLKLDIKSKQRQLKWFYPTLIGGAFTGVVSLLGQIGIIPLPKIELWHKADTTSISRQTKTVYPTHTSTTSIQTGSVSR